MRITVRQASSAVQPNVRATDTTAPGTSTVDVPNGPLAGLTALFGIISGLTATGGLATFLWITQPDARQTREIAMDDARMKALTHALQVESAEGRQMSIRLLVATGVLDPQDPRALNTLITDATKVPRWGAAETPQLAVRDAANRRATEDTATARSRR